jgi:hypothetical protein
MLSRQAGAQDVKTPMELQQQILTELQQIRSI